MVPWRKQTNEGTAKPFHERERGGEANADHFLVTILSLSLPLHFVLHIIHVHIP